MALLWGRTVEDGQYVLVGKGVYKGESEAVREAKEKDRLSALNHHKGPVRISNPVIRKPGVWRT